MSCSEGLGTILTLYYISKFCLNSSKATMLISLSADT